MAEVNPQNQQTQQPPAQSESPATQQQSIAVEVDYEKISSMIDKNLAGKEDVVLKSYFKQQGLSQQEVEQAISTFKAEKAKNQPDINALQTQLAKLQSGEQRANIEKEAILVAVSLGIDAKTIPYALKMADLSQVMGQDGKVNAEAVKEALNKLLEDIPALKPLPAQSNGFVQVGTGGNSAQQTNTDDALKKAFGL